MKLRRIIEGDIFENAVIRSLILIILNKMKIKTKVIANENSKVMIRLDFISKVGSIDYQMIIHKLLKYSLFNNYEL